MSQGLGGAKIVTPESHIEFLHVVGLLQMFQKPDANPRSITDSNRYLLKMVLEGLLKNTNDLNEERADISHYSRISRDGDHQQETGPGLFLRFNPADLCESFSDHKTRLSSGTNTQARLVDARDTYFVLDKLYAVCLATDAMDDDLLEGSWSHSISGYLQERTSPPKTRGTGQWLLEDDIFIRWRSRPDGIFWLSGSHGTGKSTMTSFILDTLQSNKRDGEIFAIYRIDPGFRAPSTVAGILWEILIQLRLREPAGKTQLDLQSVLTDLLQSGDRLTLSRMNYIFSKAKHCLKAHETLYLFVDGLSDFESQNDRDLLHGLFDHAGRFDPNHRIKLFISCSQRFFGTRDFGGSLRVDIDNHPKAKRDLALYVKDAFHKRPEDQDLGKLWKIVRSQPGNSFLRARLILQSAGLVSGADSPTRGTAGHIYPGVSAELPTLFAELFGQIENKDRKVVTSALHWIVYAARPLHATELLSAVYLQTGTELSHTDILKVCGSLVVMDENRTFRTAHYSVRDFLESTIKGDSSALSLEANEMIAGTCLDSLYPHSLLRSLRLLTVNSAGLKPERTERPRGHGQSLLGYARRYWIRHYKLAEPGSSYIAGLLHGCLYKCLSSFDLVNTALKVGARFGFPKLVRLELEMGANVNFASGPEGHTPLIWAVKSGHFDTVKLLLEYGADPQIPSGSGVTPLMFAVANGHLEIMELLLEHGSRSLVAHDWEYSLSSTSSVADSITDEPCLESILTLETVFLPPCTTCGAVETCYQVTHS